MSDQFADTYENNDFEEGAEPSYLEQLTGAAPIDAPKPNASDESLSKVEQQSRNFESLAPDIRTSVPGMEEHAATLLKQVEESEDPEEEWQRVQASMALADRLRMDVDHVYKNFDFYAREITGQNTTNTRTVLEAMQNENIRGQIQKQISQVALQLNNTDDPQDREEIESRIQQLNERMPPKDDQDRGLFGSVARDTAYAMRQMLNSASYALRDGAVGAAVGGFGGAVAGAISPVPGDILPLIASGMKLGGSWGARAGYAEGTYRMEGGGIISELLQMKGPNGEEIDTDVIRQSANIPAALMIIPEMAGLRAVTKGIPGADKLVDKTVGRTLRNLSTSKLLQNGAVRFSSRVASGAGVEAGTEIVQEGMGVAATERAKQLQNYMEENENIALEELRHQFDLAVEEETFEHDEAEQIWEQLKEIALKTFRGTLALSGVGSTRQVLAENAAQRRAKQFVNDQSMESLQALAEATEAERDEQAVSRAQELDAEEESLQSELRRLQGRREQVSEEETAAVDEAIADIEHHLEAVELERKGMEVTGEGQRQPWQMGSEEFKQWRSRGTSEVLRSDNPIRKRLRDTFNLETEQQVDATGFILESMARYDGRSVEDFMSTRMRDGGFVTGDVAQDIAQGHPAAINFDEMGRALIAATEKADFTSFVHEAGHLFRRILKPEDMKAAEQWAGVEDGQWTVEQEEAFTEALEDYLRNDYGLAGAAGEGVAPIKKVLRKISDELVRFLENFRQRWEIDENITGVFDNLFLAEEQATPEDIQPGFRSTTKEQELHAIRTAIRNLDERRIEALENEDQATADDLARQAQEMRELLAEAASTDTLMQPFSPEERIERLKEEMPGITNILPYLSESEKAKLKRDTVKKIEDLYNSLPSADEMAGVAIAGQAKKGWYRNSARALTEIFGSDDANRFALFLAALSPQTSVESNFINTLSSWRTWIQRGRPTDREAIIDVLGDSVQGSKGRESVLPGWINNAVTALSSTDPINDVISGPKVSSFAKNLRNVLSEVTNDTWIANYILMEQKIFGGRVNAAKTDPGKGPSYIAMSAVTRRAAEVATDLTGEQWAPAEIQETVWSWVKAVYEYRASAKNVDNKTVREIIDAGLIIDDMINDVPDFEVLMLQDTYASILKDAGYEQELDYVRQVVEDRGRSGGRDGGRPQSAEVAEAARRATEEAAGRLEQLYQQRRAATETLNQPERPSEHEQAVRLAIAEGKLVPREVIEEYADKTWAQEELARRDREEVRRTHFSGLRTVARQFKSPKEFREHLKANYPEIAEEATSEAWYERFWMRSVAESSSRDDMNKMWLRQMFGPEAVGEFLRLIWSNRDRLANSGVDPLIWGIAQQDTLANHHYEAARKVFEANPAKYRKIDAIIHDDTEALRILAREAEVESLNATHDELEEKLRRVDPYSDHYRIANEVDDLKTRAQILSESVSEKKLAQRVEKLEGQLKEAKAKVREQGAEMKERRQADREALQSARAEARATAKYIRQLERERRAAKRMKQQMRDIARKITRAVPKSVDVSFREQIEAIQAGIDPSFRSNETIKTWQARKEFAKRHPDAYALFPKKFQERLYKKALNEYTLEELQEIHKAVESLKEQGKAELKQKRNTWKGEMEAEVQAILDRLMGDELIGIDESELTGREGLSSAKSAHLSNIRPERIADSLDGQGSNFSGPAWQAFIGRQRHGREREFRNKYQREDFVSSKMEELGITKKQLSEVGYTFANGKILSRDEMLDIYAKRKNERSYLTVTHGNQISEAVQQDIVSRLTDNEKRFADNLIDEYERNYNRLREAYAYLENEQLGKEEFYTPLIVRDVDYESFEAEISAEAEMRSSIRKASLEKGFLTDRQDIPQKYRKPTRLGIYSMWKSSVDKQEHYIESADAVKRMRYILKNESFKQAVKQKLGPERLEQLRDYVNRIANPSIYTAHSTWDKIAKFIRSNSALAYLSFNLVTMTKQLPSAMFFIPYAGHHWFSAVGESMTNWQETRAWLEQAAPQLKERSLMRSMEELKVSESAAGSAYGKYREFISKVGMSPIRFFDKIAITVGFRGVYLAQIEAGKSEREAIDMATSVTMRTQPEAHAAEVPSLYAKQNLWGLMLQFTNQLNNIYNMATYDAPKAIKSGQLAQGAAIYMGIGLSAAVMWMLSTKSVPDIDEPDDWTEMALQQIMATTPVMGSMLTAGFNGFDNEISVEVAPQVLGSTLGKLHRAAFSDDSSIGSAEYTMKELAQALSTVSGMPYVFGERVYETGKAVSEEEFERAIMEFILGGETIEAEKE